MSTHYLTCVEQPQVPLYQAADMAQGLYVALARFLAPLAHRIGCRHREATGAHLSANRGGHPDVSRSCQWAAAEPNGRVS
jgi:hypothetical protein